MFTNPGSRTRPGGIGQEKIKNSITVGANVTINSSVLFLGNSVSNIVSNTIALQIANNTSQTVITPIGITIGANLVMNTTVFFSGNSTANAFGNSIIDIFANSLSQTVITPVNISIGNATVNTSVANAKITLAGAGSNQGLVLGTKSLGAATANGYTFLPNGVLLQFGTFGANLTGITATFQVAFPTACFSVVATGNAVPATASLANVAWVVVSAVNTTTFNCKTSNSTQQTINYMAVGN